ncbi:MAG: lysostaphin resistance A-like protein [Pirellulales bacterium]
MFESRRSRWVFLLLEATCLPAAWALGWLLGVEPAATLRWSYSAVAMGMAAALPGLAVVLAMRRWRPVCVQPLLRLIDDLLVPAFAHWTVGELLLVSFLAGVGEELLFRGVVQQALISPLGPWSALIAASLCFGVLHALSASYAVFATLMGLYLGWLWMASGNLLVPIAAHAAYDFLALVWLVRGKRAPA